MFAGNINFVDFEGTRDCFIFEFFVCFGQFVYIFPYYFIIIIFSRKIQMLQLNLFPNPNLNLID